MQVTYASQRCIVNSKNSVKIIKEEWPVLFENNSFTAHASTLLGIELISDKILCKNIDIKGNIIYNYMNCNSKKDSIFECLKTINNAKELGCKDAETLGAVLLIPAYFGEEQEELFEIYIYTYTSKVYNLCIKYYDRMSFSQTVNLHLPFHLKNSTFITLR